MLAEELAEASYIRRGLVSAESRQSELTMISMAIALRMQEQSY
jgi:hypothetical protein